MYQGYHRIFWGLVFITFHITLGSIQILPGLVGCLVIASGAGLLVAGHSSELYRRALITAWFLVCISFIQSLTGWFQYQSLWLSYGPIVFSIGEFVFSYSLLEGGRQQLADAGEKEAALELEREIFYILLMYILFLVLECIGFAINHQMLLVITVLFGLVIRLIVMANLRKLMNALPSFTEGEKE